MSTDQVVALTVFSPFFLGIVLMLLGMVDTGIAHSKKLGYGVYHLNKGNRDRYYNHMWDRVYPSDLVGPVYEDEEAAIECRTRMNRAAKALPSNKRQHEYSYNQIRREPLMRVIWRKMGRKV